MSMNEVFIWLSGHRIIDFRIFTENNPIMGYSKTFFIPEAKGLNGNYQCSNENKNVVECRGRAV